MQSHIYNKLQISNTTNQLDFVDNRGLTTTQKSFLLLRDITYELNEIDNFFKQNEVEEKCLFFNELNLKKAKRMCQICLDFEEMPIQLKEEWLGYSEAILYEPYQHENTYFPHYVEQLQTPLLEVLEQHLKNKYIETLNELKKNVQEEKILNLINNLSNAITNNFINNENEIAYLIGFTKGLLILYGITPNNYEPISQ